MQNSINYANLTREELFTELECLTGELYSLVTERGAHPQEYPELISMTFHLSEYDQIEDPADCIYDYRVESRGLINSLKNNGVSTQEAENASSCAYHLLKKLSKP